MHCRFIGDVHGKFDEYMDIISETTNTIQVGDFGAGFNALPDIGSSHRFIRGNHDDPSVCRNSPNFIIDGTYHSDMFFLGGALSIDKQYRIKGVSWWEDEELSKRELERIISDYDDYRPGIMISHDGPEQAIRQFPGQESICLHKSRTRTALNKMLSIHRPKIWIFGHWHRTLDVVLDGTRFICIPELSYVDLDI